MPALYFAARWAAVAMLLTSTLTLAACGYKGDLFLPPNVAANMAANVAAVPSPAPAAHPLPQADEGEGART